MGVEIRFTKWGGKRHWRYSLEVLGTDRYGWWLGGRTGIQTRRGLEDPIVQPHDFVALVHAVDLDLDVVRLRDVTVAVLDEDEFADHQVRYGYPPEVIKQALATTDDLVSRISTDAEPFATVGATWLAGFSARG